MSGPVRALGIEMPRVLYLGYWCAVGACEGPGD